MLNVAQDLKLSFLSAAQKNLVLSFDDGTKIDNDDIAMESMSLEQTLCDRDELKFGKVSSACFKTKIKASTKSFKNLWFNASLTCLGHEIKLGRFKVYSDNMTSDKLYRDIVAYDALFWASNADVTEWYNNLSFPIPQKMFRDSLFSKLGIQQLSVVLPNDAFLIQKTIEPESITGLKVLESICEINATWGTLDGDGKFKYVRTRTHERDALYPSDDLYPSEELYPDAIYDDVLTKGSYYQGTLKYEEYDTKPITKVIIRENADDVGYSYGTDGNTYIIENNFLLYGASNQNLDTVASNFYDYAQHVIYTPSELSCKGTPWRELGDLLSVVADKRVFFMPILSRTLSGITALKDTYVAKGKETYGETKNGVSEQIKQLKGRTNKLTQTVDETKSELQSFENDTNGKLATMTSSITQTSNSITAEVTRAQNAESNLSSRITQTADSVSSKVSKGAVISEINQTAGTIEFKADRKITVDAPNWKVDGNGSQTCKDISITGGSIALSGTESSPKFVIETTAGSTAGSCRFFPTGFKYFDNSNNVVAQFIRPAGFILRTYSGSNVVLETAVTYTGISTNGLTVNGNLKVTGTTTLASSPVISSDRDLKKDIEEITNASNFIYSLKPCQYRYKDGTSNRLHHGFIAQEVKECMGENDWGLYVCDGETDKKGIRYEELIADLVATVQEQNERIKILEERLGV